VFLSFQIRFRFWSRRLESPDQVRYFSQFSRLATRGPLNDGKSSRGGENGAADDAGQSVLRAERIVANGPGETAQMSTWVVSGNSLQKYKRFIRESQIRRRLGNDRGCRRLVGQVFRAGCFAESCAWASSHASRYAVCRWYTSFLQIASRVDA
jgi:hypothetical protein